MSTGRLQSGWLDDGDALRRLARIALAREGRIRSGMAAAAIAAAMLATGVLHAQTAPPTPTPTPAPLSQTDKDPNKRCLQCHGQPHIAEMGPVERRSMVGTRLDADQTHPAGEPVPEAPLTGAEPAKRPGLLVHSDQFDKGPHAQVKCIECHTDAEQLPHTVNLNLATCAKSCHTQARESYDASAHRKATDAGNDKAPTCASCHGGHEILRVSDRKAPQHHLNNLFLCGDCHKQHGVDENGVESADRISGYLASAHAKAVTGAGLMWGATCSDCHGAHGVLKSSDPSSSVHRSRIPETCGKCHVGVAETYATSVHGQRHAENDAKAAVCTDCHTAHEISRANSPAFLLDIVNECGECHDKPDGNGDRKGTYYQTYHESYHGQVTRLGSARAARCSDCHGSHDIRPLSDPTSRVSGQNLVATCGRCHPGANASFVKFDPHANYLDGKNYPVLHGVWLYFMIMMSSVFTFFGVHTLLWFLRSMFDRIRHGRPERHAHGATAIRRFTTLNRINHLLVALTFFGLTATGIPLVFSHQKWASILAALFGGVEAAGQWHRFFAILLIINFVLHFVGLAQSFRRRKGAWHEWMFGPNSLAPRWKDVTDCVGMFQWFFGRRRKPSLDRWTYWEKFDYWAEVGGSMIIGGSGLLLWFPVLAARFLPGWTFNVAMVVHGYEALLAIGFIFTIHFFNAHIRPGTFPVDEVIFTGSMPEHELKETRPEEYQRLLASGELESLRVPAPPPSRRPLWVLTAIVTVGIGVTLLVLIIAGGLRLF